MRCTHLAAYPDYLPTLAKWGCREWRHLYAGSSEESFQAEFAVASSTEYPMTLLALEGNDLLGTVSLIRNDLPGREDLNPWLASLYVRPEARGCGVASFLVREAENIFRLRGEAAAYLFTESATGLFEKLGWSYFDVSEANGYRVNILRKLL